MANYLDEAGLAELWELIKNQDDKRAKIELLWENASPTSSFAAQTVSVDLSGYDMIAIQVYCPARTQGTAKIPAGGQMFMLSLDGTSALHLSGFYFNTTDYFNGNYVVTSLFYRPVSIADASLSFSDCAFIGYGGSASDGRTGIWYGVPYTDNGYGVPTHIYGIKGGQA